MNRKPYGKAARKALKFERGWTKEPNPNSREERRKRQRQMKKARNTK